MIKKNWILLLLLISLSFCYAQKDSVYSGGPPTNKPRKTSRPKKDFDFKNKLFYGANFSLLFGTYTLINLTPSLGYKLTDKLHVGAGIIYYYSSVNYGGIRYSQSLYGTHLFARYFLNNNIYLQGQYDRLNQINYLAQNYTNEKIWVGYAMAGIGYKQPIGDRAAIMTSILYNFTPSPLSVYFNPYFQIGFVAGF